jgi:hypothetical protein
VKEDLALAAGFAVAGLGPLTAASILLPLREQPYVTSIVGVVLIVVIVASAVLAGPVAGAVATVTAVLSFDFLFVRPYLVLKMPSGDEVWPVVALLALGSLVVAVVRRRWPPSVDAAPPARCNPNQSRHIERIVRLIEQGADPRDLTSAVQAELTSLLLLLGCRFETGDSSNPRPRIGRERRVVGPDGVVPLAHETLELPVRVRGHVVGRFVLTPTPGVSIPLEHRIVAVILTDHLAAAITSRAAAARN